MSKVICLFLLTFTLGCASTPAAAPQSVDQALEVPSTKSPECQKLELIIPRVIARIEKLSTDPGDQLDKALDAFQQAVLVDLYKQMMADYVQKYADKRL